MIFAHVVSKRIWHTHMTVKTRFWPWLEMRVPYYVETPSNVEGTPSNVARTFRFKPRPESGLDRRVRVPHSLADHMRETQDLLCLENWSTRSRAC